jgi:bacterioferritin-associated ferredoxin
MAGLISTLATSKCRGVADLRSSVGIAQQCNVCMKGAACMPAATAPVVLQAVLQW